jgi:hypothetical protein
MMYIPNPPDRHCDRARSGTCLGVLGTIEETTMKFNFDKEWSKFNQHDDFAIRRAAPAEGRA